MTPRLYGTPTVLGGVPHVRLEEKLTPSHHDSVTVNGSECVNLGCTCWEDKGGSCNSC